MRTQSIASLLCLPALMALLSACGRADETSADGGTDLRSQCQTADPPFRRDCVSDQDCVAVLHTLNCCGSTLFTGLNVVDQARFVAIEQACVAGLPACGCASGPPTTDDGSTLTTYYGAGEAGVTCKAGQCTTYAKACGAPCPSGESCHVCPGTAPLDGACTRKCSSSAECTDPARPVCQFGFGGGVCVADGATCTP